MSKKTDHIQNELDSHILSVTSYVDTVKGLKLLKTDKGVSERFLRDCDNTLSDLKKAKSPTQADLVDFTNICNSLEIRTRLIKNGTPC